MSAVKRGSLFSVGVHSVAIDDHLIIDLLLCFKSHAAACQCFDEVRSVMGVPGPICKQSGDPTRAHNHMPFSTRHTLQRTPHRPDDDPMERQGNMSRDIFIISHSHTTLQLFSMHEKYSYTFLSSTDAQTCLLHVIYSGQRKCSERCGKMLMLFRSHHRILVVQSWS